MRIRRSIHVPCIGSPRSNVQRTNRDKDDLSTTRSRVLGGRPANPAAERPPARRSAPVGRQPGCKRHGPSTHAGCAIDPAATRRRRSVRHAAAHGKRQRVRSAVFGDGRGPPWPVLYSWFVGDDLTPAGLRLQASIHKLMSWGCWNPWLFGWSTGCEAGSKAGVTFACSCIARFSEARRFRITSST